MDVQLEQIDKVKKLSNTLRVKNKMRNMCSVHAFRQC